MFNALQQRIRALRGTKVCSFEELPRLELDSVDSVCLSDTIFMQSSEHPSDELFIENNCLFEITTDNKKKIEDYCMRKVVLNIKSIKRLESIRRVSNSRINMIAFFDLLHDQQYKDVGMGLLSDFINKCRMIPKSYYLHYYMYFLCYASYYHYMRYFVDVIDTNMVPRHKFLWLCSRYQLKILQYIINSSRAHG